MMALPAVRSPLPAVLPAAILALAAAGCVERKMILRSEPPGAVAYVDDEKVGVTPCETAFSHYGTRRVVLEYRREEFLKANGGTAPPRFEAGFRRVDVDAPLSVPWFQWPVFDLITEIAIPFTVKDTQTFVYPLQPADPLPEKADVLDRAKALQKLMRERNEEERRNLQLRRHEARAPDGEKPPPPSDAAAPK